MDVCQDSIYPNLKVHDYYKEPEVEFFDRNPNTEKSLFIKDNYFWSSLSNIYSS